MRFITAVFTMIVLAALVSCSGENLFSPQHDGTGTAPGFAGQMMLLDDGTGEYVESFEESHTGRCTEPTPVGDGMIRYKCSWLPDG